MKKALFILLGIAILAIPTYLFLNPNPTLSEGSVQQNACRILKGNNCLACHSASAEAPFYASFPIIGKQVKEDMRLGLRYFDLDPIVADLKEGRPVSNADLSKIEYVLVNTTMPPLKYQLIHWGSHLTKKEREVLFAWIREERQQKAEAYATEEHWFEEPILPIAEAQPVDEKKAKLGYLLFHDTRLSGDNTVSCASCHNLSTGGVDRSQFSEGINGQFGGVNAPTVYNAVHNTLQFWDGRAKDLQEQAAGPPLNPVEMGSASFDEISAKLQRDPAMRIAFAEIYPEGINQHTITDAIAEFEKCLVTPNSRFDRYLKGDTTALTEMEQEGYALFKTNKCATCHSGENMGGYSFELMGLADDYFGTRGESRADNKGRINVTGEERDMHRFKTPTLRNAALTYPYLHDGTAKDLTEATKVMLQYQSGKELSDADIAKIVAFLETLTGEMPDLNRFR